MRYRDVMKRWASDRGQQPDVLDIEIPDQASRHGEDDPQRRGVVLVQALRLLDDVNDEGVVGAMVLTADGWSQQEIADRYGITEKTVERMLANERARQRRRMAIRDCCDTTNLTDIR